MDKNDMRLLSDDELELVSGGATKAYLAAVVSRKKSPAANFTGSGWLFCAGVL